MWAGKTDNTGVRSCHKTQSWEWVGISKQESPEGYHLEKCVLSWTPISEGFQIAWVTFQFWSDSGTFWPSLFWKLLLPGMRPLPSHLGWNCRVSLWPGPRLGSHCSPASAWLCIPRPLPCPALSSWNQSAHLFKQPLHQRSPGSCLPPRAAGLSFIAFLKFQISCLGCALRVRILPHSRKEILTRVWRGREGENPAFPEPALQAPVYRDSPRPPRQAFLKNVKFLYLWRGNGLSLLWNIFPFDPSPTPTPAFSYWSRHFHLKNGSCMFRD